MIDVRRTFRMARRDALWARRARSRYIARGFGALAGVKPLSEEEIYERKANKEVRGG